MKARILGFAERLLWALAVLCLLPLGVTTAARHLAASTKLELPPSDTVAFELPSIAEKQPSQGLWSHKRRSEFARLKDLFHRAEIARLEFPTLDVLVPVFAGDDEVSMTLGAGHLSDTSSVQGHGNIAITSHRDGAFRVLKDLETGDRILGEGHLQVETTVRGDAPINLALDLSLARVIS